jgi:hypothetical protein
VQAIIIYTIGIKLWLYTEDAGVHGQVSTLASFAVCASLVALGSEFFYRLVDLPSIAAARGFWTWMTN